MVVRAKLAQIWLSGHKVTPIVPFWFARGFCHVMGLGATQNVIFMLRKMFLHKNETTTWSKL